jgi:LuxR family maltose regulon positive regulatory protein
MAASRKSTTTAPRRAYRRKPARAHHGAVFEILQSKLLIPSLRRGLVPRTALVNRLRKSSETRVVSIAAPAGYGKTTLIAQWAARDPRPFAWVSLDDRDDDPVSLLTYVAAALHRIRAVELAVFRGAAAPGSLWSTGMPRLGSALAAMPEPIVLVLDDVHELRHPDCKAALEPISKHLPSGSQLVLSGRAENGAPLARLRAQRQLLEVSQKDLALSDSEARSLLTTAGAKLSETEAMELNSQAEGWVAGLHLAALAMTESEGVVSFTGDDRFVADYLRSEHLSRLKRSDLEFLTRTAVLDRMCGPLCDEVLERTDSTRRLWSLEDANAFVVPLDRHREWYRYHHLFQEMLRAELERREPQLAGALRRRAAAWYERHGEPETAIEYAAAAEDIDEVARLVGTCALPFFRRGRVVTVERWFRLFDEPELLGRYPTVAAFGAWVSALRGHPDDAERFAYALEHSVYEGPMPDGSTSVRSWAAMVRALLCHHGVSDLRSNAELALEGLSRSSYWRPPARLLLGVGFLLEGDLEQAEAILTKTAKEALGSGAVHVGVVAHSELAVIALDRGDLARAETELRGADEFLRDQPIEEYLTAALRQAAGARLALARGQAASARELLVRAMRMRAHLSSAIPWYCVQTQLELARSHIALADMDGARTLLREAEDVIQRRPDLGTLPRHAGELRAQLASAPSLDHGWASTLTAAELRLLPLLTTHLSFREIAERLYVSRNTVKSQAISVYRKLDASSRSEAIERAVQLGLVDAPVTSASAFTPSG